CCNGGNFLNDNKVTQRIQKCKANLYDGSENNGLKGFDLFLHVILPASIPHAVTGLRLAWAFSWRALMAAELLSTGPGLGYTLSYASDFNNMSLVIGIIIIIGFIGSFVDQLVFQ